MSQTPASTDPIEIKVGRHLFRWEPPDIGYVSYCGDLDADAAASLSAVSRQFTVGKPRIFLLVNLARVGQISKEARSSSAAGSKDLSIRGIAVVGAALIPLTYGISGCIGGVFLLAGIVLLIVSAVL